MRRLTTSIGAAALVFLGGCFGTAASTASDNNQTIEVRAQDKIAANFDKLQPIPFFARSQLRQNLTEIETAQARGVQTTTFFFNMGIRDPIQTCPSIGAPIPTTTQLTNPEQPLRDNSQPLNNGGGNIAIGQMEPTGVYAGASTGTYVMCLGADGKSYADYWEGFVQTVFGPARWNTTTHQIELVGPASFTFSGGK